ncbi:16S rRNA (adenine(1518)-N(6)/adenine(1519)-N(6))-dimethyltransferase RsmA [Buchnera aphidicola]|uniref:16S rRNA (adenine(1518)-N(6)/adenine(1519)-N(6))- dimethyltransferase RsmA n=1 Tax=Buchnera aphidicola TaxID=9 RepID=UPI00223754AE|nr:16S rRNA (adenine(1518)-N(6)/adenine(1519)-N(6))-dimethyltransferase RsmA [Buchnera aphidicola (Stegophylla sp.)]
MLKPYVAKKKFGQHFLCKKSIVNKIINILNPKKHELLIEVGPGLASLTKPICNILDKLIVIELDKELSKFLIQSQLSQKIKIFIQDVNIFDFREIAVKTYRLLRIFGNLPYNISVSFILYLIQFKTYIFDMYFMVQKEVAERFVALPGSKLYGRLSVISQCYYDIFLCFHVLPISFFPEPQVQSIFIKITPKILSLYSKYHINCLNIVTLAAFQKRRKMLKNSLSNIFTEDTLLYLGINPFERAENVSVFNYCKMANFLYFSKYNKN